jgi:hypothetical protein
MYNEELKNRFLSQRRPTTQKHLKYLLNRAELTEQVINKDIYEMSSSEVDSLIRSFSPKSRSTVDVIISAFRNYITWCIEQGYVPDRINYFDTIGGKDLEKYIDKMAAENKYITYEQLLEIENLCANAQDAAIPELPFIGIKGEEAAEMLNLKFSNVQRDKIILPDREIPISDRTYELIMDAYNQTEYLRNNGNVSESARSTIMHLNTSDFILKSSGKNKVGALTYPALLMRMARIKDYFDNPYITINNLWVSGQINLAKQIKEEKGELTKDDYIEINKRFGYAEVYWSLTKQRIQDYI